MKTNLSKPFRKGPRSRRGFLMVDLVVAMAILSLAIVPLGFSFARERQVLKIEYQRSVANEIVDGEMEILAAGDWKNFPDGAQAYHGPFARRRQPAAGTFSTDQNRKPPAPRMDARQTQGRRRGRPRNHRQMKLPQNISRARGASGMLLMECLVYVFVFAILLGGATTAFYFCWNHSEALIYATDDITSALHAGERWRADVRAATGKITVETTATGEVVRIPEGARKVFYRFESGEVRRQTSASGNPQLLLAKVKTSRNETGCAGRRHRVALGIGDCSRAARKRFCRCCSRSRRRK